VKVLWCSLAVPLLASCSGTAPPGYIEACYGGDFARNLSGQRPILAGQLDIPDSQWPHLTEVLLGVSERHHLKFFNDTRREPTLQMINVSLCSSDGLFMNADRRTFRDDHGKVTTSIPLTITVFAYKNRDTWTAFAQEVKAALDAEWPGKLTSDPNVEIQLKNSIL
jgi:hypothetical protein